MRRHEGHGRQQINRVAVVARKMLCRNLACVILITWMMALSSRSISMVVMICTMEVDVWALRFARIPSSIIRVRMRANGQTLAR